MSEAASGGYVGRYVGRYVGCYVGRFAPSPTGVLHAGSLAAALASWLDARAHGGRWLVRFEDVDTPRCVPGAAAEILRQLDRCALRPDDAAVYQSQHSDRYAGALQRLLATGAAFDCACSRADVLAALLARGAVREHGGELVYPGTCRGGLQGRPPRAVRALADATIRWCDRRLGVQAQDIEAEVGDFVLKRADGCWAYQLAVVVDDAAQGITHVVRGADLADNTPRQILLQRRLGLPTPVYLHTPLVFGADGHKLSKQNGAVPLDLADPLAALRDAGAVLGIGTGFDRAAGATVAEWLNAAVHEWPSRLASWRPATADKTTS